ncbi:MAG: methionine adenosyltransferase [Candidatus Eisenbacteria bacterium]|nr:methionine adenosyltransferase [Candidatus Eisenbacteria bacterium]
MEKNRLFTSESVSEGHPDKVADQISDGILDALIELDPLCRVACETLVTTGLVFVAGEISTSCYVEIPEIVRSIVRDIGYTDASYGFDYETCAVITSIDDQSEDIALGVDKHGAGDQGLMFGYATTETPELMPLPILLAHRLARRLAHVRKAGILPYLRPDGKTQVTVRYEGDRPVGVETVIVSTQHHPDVAHAKIENDVIESVIKAVIPKEMLQGRNVNYFVNPTGRFVKGGPLADTGLTGRKIIVDTYGGVGSHGGGCFSGKDPSKVDRSASYACRHVAKNIVAAGLATKCEIQVAYAIGIAKPVSVTIDTFGTGQLPDDEISRLVTKHFDLTPLGIIERLKLRRPIYRSVAVYGHFGREEPNLTWEFRDMVDVLKKGV